MCIRGRGWEDAAPSQTHQALLGGGGGGKEPSGALEGAQPCLHLLDFGPRLQSCEQRSACSFKALFVVIHWGGARTQAHWALV